MDSHCLCPILAETKHNTSQLYLSSRLFHNSPCTFLVLINMVSHLNVKLYVVQNTYNISKMFLFYHYQLKCKHLSKDLRDLLVCVCVCVCVCARKCACASRLQVYLSYVTLVVIKSGNQNQISVVSLAWMVVDVTELPAITVIEIQTILS